MVVKVYEDPSISIELREDGAAVGHIIVKPKKEAKTLMELSGDEAEYLFMAASYAATALFEGLGAQGTNILLIEGEPLGVHVLPRSQADGIDLFWEPKKLGQAELEQVASKLSERLWYVGKEEPKKEPPKPAPQAAGETPEASEPKVNYKFKQLDRRL